MWTLDNNFESYLNVCITVKGTTSANHFSNLSPSTLMCPLTTRDSRSDLTASRNSYDKNESEHIIEKLGGESFHFKFIQNVNG